MAVSTRGALKKVLISRQVNSCSRTVYTYTSHSINNIAFRSNVFSYDRMALTLVFDLDLDVLKVYLHFKNEVSRS